MNRTRFPSYLETTIFSLLFLIQGYAYGDIYQFDSTGKRVAYLYMENISTQGDPVYSNLNQSSSAGFATNDDHFPTEYSKGVPWPEYIPRYYALAYKQRAERGFTTRIVQKNGTTFIWKNYNSFYSTQISLDFIHIRLLMDELRGIKPAHPNSQVSNPDFNKLVTESGLTQSQMESLDHFFNSNGIARIGITLLEDGNYKAVIQRAPSAKFSLPSSISAVPPTFEIHSTSATGHSVPEALVNALNRL